MNEPPAVDFPGIKARITASSLEAITDVFHRMPWGAEITLSNGTTCKLKPFVEPRLNDEGRAEFGFDLAGATWHLEFMVTQTGWGGAP